MPSQCNDDALFETPSIILYPLYKLLILLKATVVLLTTLIRDFTSWVISFFLFFFFLWLQRILIIPWIREYHPAILHVIVMFQVSFAPVRIIFLEILLWLSILFSSSSSSILFISLFGVGRFHVIWIFCLNVKEGLDFSFTLWPSYPGWVFGWFNESCFLCDLS